MIPFSSGAVTLDWLNSVLSQPYQTTITDFSCETIGGGAGVLGELSRIRLDSEGGIAPASVIGKFSAPVPEARQAAGSMSFYENEHRFYHEMATAIPIRVPRTYFQHYDPGTQEFVLLMEDAEGDVVDQLVGCNLTQLNAAIDTLVELHAWGHENLTAYPWVRPVSETRLQDAVKASLAANAPLTVARFAEQTPDWLQRRARDYPAMARGFGDRLHAAPNQTILHGDYRADNLVFNDTGEQLTLDWQIVLAGPACFDVGYLLSQSVPIDLRRNHGERVINRYLDGMAARGIDIDPSAFMANLKLVFAQNLTYPLIGGGIINDAFERSAQLIETMLQRACAAVEDYDCFEYL